MTKKKYVNVVFIPGPSVIVIISFLEKRFEYIFYAPALKLNYYIVVNRARWFIIIFGHNIAL